MDLISHILMLVLGLVFFLFGMHVMSQNLEKMAGGKLEHTLKKVTSNPFISLLLGAGITIAIQSSSATTVMLVGLVNSGIMKFSQTLYVIFGANIGTTLTSWILSLSGIESKSIAIQMMKPENFSPLFALAGIIMLMCSKSDRKRSVGTIFVGFAVLMYGMVLMSDAVSPLADMPEFSDLMVKFNNPLIAVVFSTLFTALIQSSAASVGILQALSMTGSITYAMAIPIVMGQNIGTCVTSVISCIGTNANAKRVAAIHLSVNAIGTAILLSVYCALDAIFNFAFSDLPVSPVTVAMIHTVFNVAITAMFIPCGKWILKLAETVVPDRKKSKSKKSDVFTLDERLLRSPSVAINECSGCTVKMAELSQKTLLSAIQMFKKYDKAEKENILQNETKIDKMEDLLGSFLVKLSAQALSVSDSRSISKMLHTIGDFERLSDHAVNLLKAATEIHDKGLQFSKEASAETALLSDAVTEILSLTMEAYKKNDAELAAKVEPLEQVIDRLTAKIKSNHIERLQSGACTIEMGFILSDMLNNFERISDHCSNIAVAVIELIHGSFDTHKYLTGVKYGDDEFKHDYESYKEKYALA